MTAKMSWRCPVWVMVSMKSTAGSACGGQNCEGALVAARPLSGHAPAGPATACAPHNHSRQIGARASLSQLTYGSDHGPGGTAPQSQSRTHRLTVDFDVGFVDEPAVARRVPREAGRVDQQRCEPLHLAVDGDVVDFDTAFDQQLLDVELGQSIAQIPPHRQHDHLDRKPETRERRAGRRQQARREANFTGQSCPTLLTIP